MASDIRQQIERVGNKARVLGEKYQSLRQSYLDARSEISELKAQVKARDEMLRQLNVKLEQLTIASTISASAADLDATHALIANLIRELDRCINDLLE